MLSYPRGVDQERHSYRQIVQACRNAIRQAGVKGVLVRRDPDGKMGVVLCERDRTPRCGVAIYGMGATHSIAVPHTTVPRHWCPYTQEDDAFVADDEAGDLAGAAELAVIWFVKDRLGWAS
jgi:hypothetical protein